MRVSPKKKLLLFKVTAKLLNMKKSQYSIKDLENLTNIKAHTIRIWEQRYELLHPKRTTTNIRYYEDEDLKKLLNINLLYTNGLKISKIASLSEDEIMEKTKSIIEGHYETDSNEVDVMLIAILEMNADKIDEILENALKDTTIEDFYVETLNPLLVKIGDLWRLNSISIGHEHFFSNILRAFLLSKTRELVPLKSRTTSVLMFLPPHEEHELGLLIYNYIFKREGWNIIYLGKNVPYEDLAFTYKQVKPDLVLTSLITNITANGFNKIIQGITVTVPNKKLVVSGSMSLFYKELLPEDVRLISNQKDFQQLIV